MSPHRPIRTCVGCRTKKEKSELLRIVRTPQGKVEIDQQAVKAGRGLYLCYDIECARKALKQKSVQRLLNFAVATDFRANLMERIESAG